MQEVAIKYLDDACFIEATPGGDWIDLRARETVELAAGEYRLVPLGIMTALPAGYEAHVAARSSTFKKWGVIAANGFGIIDNSYRGEWQFPALAMRDTVIHAGDRICQMRIMPTQGPVCFTECAKLGDTIRGAGGFGSTGHN